MSPWSVDKVKNIYKYQKKKN